MSKKQLKLVIVTFIFVTILSGMGIAFYQPAKAGTFNILLSYNSHFATSSIIELEVGEAINWSISGSNPAVGIDFWFYDEFQYEHYSDGYLATGHHVSDSSTSSDSGTFVIPSTSLWYIILEHNDASASSQSTKVTITVDFPTLPLGNILKIILIVVSCAIAVTIALIVTIVVVKKKRKAKQVVEATQYKHQTVDSVGNYCPKCSQPYEAGTAFCTNCGSKLPEE